jgi:DNA-binding response OmpR family regulator
VEEAAAPLSLLLVHTDSDDGAMYAEYLRREGFDVHEAATTDSALPLVPGATAIVTGLLVRGSFDAVEFISRVRRQSSTTPIVVVSAEAGSDRIEEARAAGADVVLIQPCQPETLLDRLIETIDAQDSRLTTPPARRRLSERRAGLRGGGRRDSDLS